MAEITTDKIKEAYSRFKAYVYYDNFNLTLRSQLAEYEYDTNLDDKLTILANELNSFFKTGELSERLTLLINKSNFEVLPKTFCNSENSQRKNKVLISNQHEANYKIDSTTKIFHGDIELHLIATLWIIEEGINLHKKIGFDSYGYHLPIHIDKNKLSSEKLLFTKYFEKYQEWRDKGIKAAKNQLDEGNDVLLISLDIKNFFHSTYVDFNLLKKDIGVENKNSLTDIIQKICEFHTEKLEITDRVKSKGSLLPIGLVSSGVIANWLLSDFDKEIKDQTAPVYYGRYVDDIFIVISNVIPPDELLTENCDKTNNTNKTVEWLADRFFPKGTPLLYTNNDLTTLKFKDETKCYGLEIQTDKLRLFYFSPDWPHAMLNKFQKTLEENSSAFWFLPEEEEMTKSLDDEAYDIQYEDTINKFRSVADVKISKYGASVFLAKRIKLAILHSGSPDEKFTKEVFRLFKGTSILSLYNMWEKIFTYLVVTNDIKAIKKLHNNIEKAISQIKCDDSEEKLIKTLTNYLDISIQMAFSLNPDLYDWFAKNNENFEQKSLKIKNGIVNLRYSLLTRHHYLPLPVLVITDYYIDTRESLLSEGLFEKILNQELKLETNNKLLDENWRIPRWIYLQEVCMFSFLCELKLCNTNNMQFNDSYITKCIELYDSLNNKKLSKIIEFENPKQHNGKDFFHKIDIENLSVKSDENNINLTLGLSNMKLDPKDLQAAISNKSIISSEKRRKHIKHLNLAEQEKVDLLILPETTVPIEWLYAYADEARRKSRAFILGLEHFTLNNYCFNFSIALLPLKVEHTKEVLILPRLKNHYSPKEEFEIRKIGKEIPKPTNSFYHLIKWRNIQFTIYNCYELADVQHRSIFRSELDILFAIEYNRDTNYFSNIAESTCRDLHCYFVQANTYPSD